FPDGLSGGPVATAYGGPLVLAIDKVNDHAVKYFKDKDAYRLVIMGGTGVISDETAGKIAGNTL
ncbi:MAG: cell wall-binding repeat-containing protein, partial [Firmicutes bacterium]|nr:cell wall-binding repeat-containing protein [Bacillota bacterium]